MSGRDNIKSELEIKAIAQEVNREEREEVRKSLTAIDDRLSKQDKVLDKIADGAQAQILSATILHGSPTLGLKGFVVETQERLKALEVGQKEDRETFTARRRTDDERFVKLEAGQNRLGRMVETCTGFCKRNGKLLVTLFSSLGGGTLLHYLAAKYPKVAHIFPFMK